MANQFAVFVLVLGAIAWALTAEMRLRQLRVSLVKLYEYVVAKEAEQAGKEESDG